MYEMLLWWSWPCSRGSAWLWQCSHQECTAARRQVGVSLLRGRKPSLVGSVFWPPSRCLRAPSMLHRCSGKRARENKRGRERVKVCVFCKLSLYRFECMCVCFLWGEDLKGMQLFLYTCPPPRGGSTRACWKQTHSRDTQTLEEREGEKESLWNGRKYQTTAAEYLVRARSESCPLGFQISSA